jgi:hypothetical protein
MQKPNIIVMIATFLIANSAYSMPTNSRFNQLFAGLTATNSAPVLQANSKSKKAKKTRRHRPGQIDFIDNGETRSERDRRLLRECKGRPNSGACSGYAS